MKKEQLSLRGNVVEIAFEHMGGEGRGGRGFKKDYNFVCCRACSSHSRSRGLSASHEEHNLVPGEGTA